MYIKYKKHTFLHVCVFVSKVPSQTSKNTLFAKKYTLPVIFLYIYYYAELKSVATVYTISCMLSSFLFLNFFSV